MAVLSRLIRTKLVEHYLYDLPIFYFSRNLNTDFYREAKLMLTDAHCHLENNQNLAQLQIQNGIKSIINCQNPQEWSTNLQLTERRQPLSFGIHPWDADKFTFEEVLPYFERANVVGEIGLDTVWTKNNLDIQTPIFEKQVSWACDKQKPVILHTKGCEKLILDTIKEYPNHYMIHWYDCPSFQEEYIATDCYFSVCLAVLSDPSVIKLAKAVPLERLLIETDGLSSVKWLENRSIQVEEYPDILEKTVTTLAKLRNIDKVRLTTQLANNLNDFLR